MGSWKNHVRARLQQRDLNEKVPFVGVYTSCAQTLRIFLFAIMIHVVMMAWTIYLSLPSISVGRALWSSQTHSGWHFLQEVWWFLLMRFWWPGDFFFFFFCWLFSFKVNLYIACFQSVWIEWSWSWEKHQTPPTAAERARTPDRKGAFKMKRNYHSISPSL